MTGKFYTEAAVRPPSIQHLENIARNVGFNLDHDELVSFQGQFFLNFNLNTFLNFNLKWILK